MSSTDQSQLCLSAAGVDSAERLAPALTVLNEAHLLAWSDDPAVRNRFADELTWYLRHLPQNDTIELDAAGVTSFAQLIDRLRPSLSPDHTLEPRIEGRHGFIEALRRRPPDPVKHRFVIWRDADALLDADPEAFARCADAIFGVSAETEYANEDRLILLRGIFLGSARLHAASREPNSPFARWWRKEHEKPLWAAITGVSKPKVHRLHVI